MFAAQTCLYILLIFGSPAAYLIGLLALTRGAGAVGILLIAAAAPLAGVLYATAAGLLSLRHQEWVKPGIFPTSLEHEVYRHRRLYGLCWTLVYYSRPLYTALLAVPLLRKMILRLFGLRGPLAFSCYPDTWLRDLPLLTIGEGAYLSNRVTLGTNMILRVGQIVVNGISIGARTLIGHRSILGPGVRIGCDSELGVDTLVSLGVVIGDRCRIGAACAIGSGVVIEDDVLIDHCVVIEKGARVGRGARLGTRTFVPSGSIVPAGTDLPAGEQFTASLVMKEQARLQEGVPA